MTGALRRGLLSGKRRLRNAKRHDDGPSAPARTLQQVAARLEAGRASGLRQLWPQLERHLARTGTPDVVVLLLGGQEAATAATWGTRLPDSRVHAFVRHPIDESSAALPANVTVHVARRLADRLSVLSVIDRPDLFIDASRVTNDTQSSLRHLFFFLRDGGTYLIANLSRVEPDDPDPGARRTIARILQRVAVVRTMTAEARPRGRTVDGPLVDAVTAMDLGDGHVWLRKQGEHLLKLREWEVDEVLAARHGATWGRVLEETPSSTFTALGEVHAHGEGPIASGRRTFELPAMRLRAYDRPTVSSRQVATYGDYVLPDTWRHPNQGTLHHRCLVYDTAYMAEYRAERRPTTRRELDGSFYYFDTELPDHFGHITTDVLGRYWGWIDAVRHRPDVRPLLSVLTGRTGMTPFQRAIFTALGVDPDAAEYIQPDEAVVVQELLAATPAFENPYYVHPLMADVWRTLGENLPDRPPPVARDRIFVSRRRTGKRECTNTEEVEAYFEAAGFAIVYPEDYPYPDQRALFAQAAVIAGFGGSGMFSMMFAPHARILIIAGNSYRAANEELIAAANGNEIHYFWGRSLVQNDTERYSATAFRSDFTFDLAAYDAELRAVLRG